MLNRFSIWGWIWVPRPRMKRPCRVRLQIPADVGDDHRIAREGHRDVGAELESRRVLGGQQQRQKRIMTGFGRPAPVIPLLFQRAGCLGYLCQLIGNAPVDLDAEGATHAGNFTVSNPVCRTDA